MWNLLPPGIRGWMLLGLAVWTVVAASQAAPKVGGEGIRPRIGAFELAGTPRRSQAILDRWKEAGRAAALRSLYFDFAFLAGYALLLSLLCGWAAGVFRSPRLAHAAALLAPLQLVAGALDAIENVALLAILRSKPTPFLTGAAAACSAIKFFLAGLGVLCVLAAVLVAGARRLGSQARRGLGADRLPRHLVGAWRDSPSLRRRAERARSVR